ncbi:hypothetical protein PG999_014678 [Apiospora kogelbergensis]|uniref:Uncharacterized protein n=1 Tax=Apiospora kogelbergensis TaxID=1337665 RepID=A0AAW0Q5L3_9PEZI
MATATGSPACVQPTPVCVPNYTPACTSIGSQITSSANGVTGLPTYTLCCPETRAYPWNNEKPTSVHFTCAIPREADSPVVRCHSLYDRTVVATLSDSTPSMVTFVPGNDEYAPAPTAFMQQGATTCKPNAYTVTTSMSKAPPLQDAPTSASSGAQGSGSGVSTASVSQSPSSVGRRSETPTRWLVVSVAGTMIWGLLFCSLV